MSQTRPPRPPAVRKQIASTLKSRRERERQGLGVLDALTADQHTSDTSLRAHELRVTADAR